MSVKFICDGCGKEEPGFANRSGNWVKPSKMKLPKLKIVLIADCRCVRCSQKGYVGTKSQLCLACLNLALLMYARKMESEEK